MARFLFLCATFFLLVGEAVADCKPTASEQDCSMAQTPSLVPGTGNTWTNGVQTWAGNPMCAQAGLLLQTTSPAIDTGELIPGFHCPAAGPGHGACQEWYGKAPDIGACEFVPSGPPNTPFGLSVRLQ
jgi:hypothetical protein